MGDGSGRKDRNGGTKVVLLGTGTPVGEPGRSGPAAAVIAGGTAYLVDSGPGVVRRAAAAHRAGIVPLAVPRLDRVFLTHLHSDHTVGLPDLILSPWVLGRRKPLEVYGPAGTRVMTEHLLAAYGEDIRERLDGLEPAQDGGWRVAAHEFSSGIIYSDSNVEVEAFPVRHGSWDAFGFKFTTGDRTIVFSGDTAPTGIVVEKSRGCDLLVHEVYSNTGFDRKSPEWRRYHSAFHTSAGELALIASEARPRLLVLYHQLFWGISEEELLAEVREGYDGRMVCGEDLGVY